MENVSEHTIDTKRVVNLSLFLAENYEILTGEKLPDDFIEFKDIITGYQDAFPRKREKMDVADQIGYSLALTKFILSAFYKMTFEISKDDEAQMQEYYFLSRTMDAVIDIKEKVEKLEYLTNKKMTSWDDKDSLTRLKLENDILKEQIKSLTDRK